MWRVRKCRFSVTRISAPTHSAYAAIKASGGFRPLDSYFAPNSNGTTKSSSIVIDNVLRKPMNSRKASLVRLRCTYCTIFAGIRMAWRGNRATIADISSSQKGTFNNPKAKRYSFVSRTRRKFLFPQFLSYFSHFLNRFILVHACKRRAGLRDNLLYFGQMFLSLFNIGFCHAITPSNHSNLLYFGGIVNEGEREMK